jgi:hypothetical protein
MFLREQPKPWLRNHLFQFIQPAGETPIVFLFFQARQLALKTPPIRRDSSPYKQPLASLPDQSRLNPHRLGRQATVNRTPTVEFFPGSV